MIPSTRNLTGLSHGAAGIALALGELWRCTGDPSFLTAVTGAIAYEDSAFNDDLANWPDYRASGDAKNPKYPNFWCHGGAGIILSRLQLSRLIGLHELPPSVPPATEALRQSIDWSLHQRDANFNLCHGLAGNSEVLWEASRWGHTSAGWQERAAATADACWRTGVTFHASSRSWPCGSNADNPSLLLGRAGIGYAYLRLHDASVPSVLAFDPAKWSHIPWTGK
jgi:lantibiotic modifying enzyme